MLDGFLNVYKEQGYTSFDVVAKLRGILKQKKIGHTGTLDPMAEGVLLVCLGQATKLSEMLIDKDKTYRCVMLLGKTTDTEEADADTEEAEADPDEDEAEEEEAVEEIEAAIEVENDLRSEIVTYALQFVGNRYKYGGTNPNTGVDCSGFTSYVMRHAASVELPHSSSGQSRVGRVVSSSEMRPGDIICYGSGKKINHVALYIGNGQIVHASTERTGIKVSRWNYRTPVRIVNVLGD